MSPAALVVEAHDGPVRPGQGGDDEAHAGEEFAEVMLDLRDHAARPVPGGGLVVEAAVADQRRVTRTAGTCAKRRGNYLRRPPETESACSEQSGWSSLSFISACLERPAQGELPKGVFGRRLLTARHTPRAAGSHEPP